MRPWHSCATARTRAADALLGLSDLLRASLRGDVRHEVTLAEELAFVEQYLSLERLRMGERLRVQLDVPLALCDARVPSLCLQPLVENAVRHGLRHVPGEAVRASIRLAAGIDGRGTTAELVLPLARSAPARGAR